MHPLIDEYWLVFIYHLNNFTINILGHVFWSPDLCISIGMHPRVELVGHGIYIYSSLICSIKQFSWGCVVAHSEVLTWISLNIYWFWIHLLHLLATWISSFSAYFFKPFGLLKLWLFFLLICRFAGVLCEYFDRYKDCKYNSHSILSTNNFCYGSPNKLIYTL